MKTNKIENVCTWIKDHKIEIVCGVVTVIGGVVLYKVGQHKNSIVIALNEAEPIDARVKYKPDISIGTVIECVRYPDFDCTELLIDDVPLDAMGDLVEEIKDKIPNIPENAIINTVLSIYPSKETQG